MSETVAVTGPNGLTFHFPADTAQGLLRHSDIGNSDVKKSDTGSPIIPDLRNDLDAKREASTGGFNPRSEGGTAAGTEATAVAHSEKPAGNASTEAWYTYALANGKTGADLDGLKQTEIRALFTE
jgi:hypothetical protein